MYADPFCRTLGNSACSHLALGGSGPPCTENAFGLHSLGPQFCTYAEHFVRGSKTKMEPELHYMVAETAVAPAKCACRIWVQVYVGQVCFAYMDNWAPSACRFGMFLCARCARTPPYGSRKQR